MTSNSLVMHYLETLINDDYNNVANKQFDISFLRTNREESTVFSENLLSKKIYIITQIQKLANTENDNGERKLFFEKFVDFRWELLRLYSAMLGRLQKSLENIGSEGRLSSEELQNITDMMVVAALLKVVMFGSEHKYHLAQQTLEQLLYDHSTDYYNYQDYHEYLSTKVPIASNSYINNIIINTGAYNGSIRLPILRLNRVLNLLAVVIKDCAVYITAFNAFNSNGGSTFMGWLSFAFFIPRIFAIACGLIYSFFATEKSKLEIELGWKKRLELKLLEYWPQIANDLVWCPVGIVNYFFLASLTIPFIGFYLAISAQTYDFLVTSIKNYIDIRRLNELKKTFIELKKETGIVDDDFLASLDKRIEFDKRRCFFILANFAILMVCIIFTAPAFASINPIIPLVAAIIALLTTYFHYRNNQYFNAEDSKLFGDGSILKNSVGFLSCYRSLIKDKSTMLGKYKNGLVYDEQYDLFYLFQDNSLSESSIVIPREVKNTILNLRDDSKRVKSLSKELFKQVNPDQGTSGMASSKISSNFLERVTSFRF